MPGRWIGWRRQISRLSTLASTVERHRPVLEEFGPGLPPPDPPRKAPESLQEALGRPSLVTTFCASCAGAGIVWEPICGSLIPGACPTCAGRGWG
jgi:hypothetical protein